MCGRYYIADEDMEDMRAILFEARQRADAVGAVLKTGEIYPSNVVPVIANSRSMTPQAFAMKWGFLRPGEKGLVINARSETAAVKTLFSASVKNRRCIIPASWYYEWGRLDKTTPEKHQYGFAHADSSMLCMAGLYTLDESEKLARFVILTRPASEAVAHIHRRMPVILPRAAVNDWLSPDAEYEALLRIAIDELAIWDTAAA